MSNYTTKGGTATPDPAAISGSEEERRAAFHAARDELERVLREWLAELGEI